VDRLELYLDELLFVFVVVLCFENFELLVEEDRLTLVRTLSLKVDGLLAHLLLLPELEEV